MADDSTSGSNNKMVFTLDMDSKSFVMNLNGAETQLKNFGNSGNSTFETLAMGAMGLNQGLDLIQKVLERVQQAMEAIGKNDEFSNIEMAFKAMSASIGADGSKMMEALKQATGGAVSNIDLMQVSMRAIRSGIQADQIPILAQYAEKISLASGGMNSFSEIMEKVTRSVQSGGGGGRGLVDLGITIQQTGNRTATLNSILTQMKAQVDVTGDGYHELAEKMKAASDNTKVSLWKEAGQTIENVYTMMGGGDKIDKAVNNLDNLKAQVDAIKKAQAAGGTQAEVYANHMAQMLPIQEALNLAEKSFAEGKAKLVGLNQQETEETKKLSEALGTGANTKLALTEEQKKQAELTAQQMALDARAASELERDGQVSVKTLQDLNKAKAAEMQKSADDAKESALTGAHTVGQGAAAILAINKKLYSDLRNLQVDDEHFKQDKAKAELSYLQNNRNTVLNFEQRWTTAKNAEEDKRYQYELQSIQLSGTKNKNYLKDLETAQKAHEQNILNIKQSFAAVNVQNMQVGFQAALDKMRDQATDFSKISESMTTKTNGLMVNSFVEAAKGHGNAMQLMTSQFLEMIGTQMIQSGTFKILDGIWPPNPAELGAGAALIAAGSALVGAGAANAPSTDAGSSAGGSADAGTGGSGSSSGGAPGSATSDQMNGKSATIIVNGNLMNSKDTADYLTDLIRQNSDRTDFNIVATGGKPYT